MISNFIKINNIMVLTVLSYLIALLHEYGYADEFNFPSDMISIDIKSLFVSAFIVLVFIVLFWTASEIVNKITSKINPIFLMVISLVLFVIHICTRTFLYTNFKYLTLIILYFAVLIFFFAILNFIENTQSSSSDENTEPLIDGNDSFKLEDKKYILLLVMLFIFLPLTSFTVTKMIASSQARFYTFEFKGNKYAIIKKYDSNLITAKVTDKKLSPVVTYFTTDSLNGLALNYEEVITREGTSESKK